MIKLKPEKFKLRIRNNKSNINTFEIKDMQNVVFT